MPLLENWQLDILQASAGAYSMVTVREATGDRSVTIDSDEKQALSKCYPLNSFARKGGAGVDGKPTRRNFLVHKHNSLTAYAKTDLAINYAKAEGNELRLYMSGNNKFEGNAGEVFFIFADKKSGLPHVGFISLSTWEAFWKKPAGSTAPSEEQGYDDSEDESFQRAIFASEAGRPFETTSLRYPRDPSVAIAALKNARYQCAIDATHTTFVSAATGLIYMEAHHLIPMHLQPLFSVSLDVPENIVALCPNCHRHLHLGDSKSRQMPLVSLLQSRQKSLEARGLIFRIKEILSSYNIQDV